MTPAEIRDAVERAKRLLHRKLLRPDLTSPERAAIRKLIRLAEESLAADQHRLE